MRGTGHSRGSWRTRPRRPRVRAGQALSPVSDPVRAVPHEERGALRFTERAKTGSTLQVGGTRFLGCQHSRWPLPKFTAKARDQKRAAGGDRSSSGLTRKTREKAGVLCDPLTGPPLAGGGSVSRFLRMFRDRQSQDCGKRGGGASPAGSDRRTPQHGSPGDGMAAGGGAWFFPH